MTEYIIISSLLIIMLINSLNVLLTSFLIVLLTSFKTLTCTFQRRSFNREDLLN